MASENRLFRSISNQLKTSAASGISERNVVAALQNCLKALELNPKNFDAYFTASSCHLSQGNFEEAKSFLKQAQSQFPSNNQREIEIATEQLKIMCIEKTLSDAKEQFSQGRYEEALTDIDSLTEHTFCHEWVWRLKAVALLEMGEVSELESVIDEAQESLKCIPSNPSRRCWWCWLLLQKRWWDIEEDIKLVIDAANSLVIALESESITSLDVFPSPAGPIQTQMVWRVLSLEEASEANDKGKAFVEQKSYQEAIDCFTKALEIVKLTGAPPQFWSQLCMRRSGSYLGQDVVLEAMRDACFAMVFNPLHPCAYFTLGQVYLFLDHPSATCALLKKMKDRCSIQVGIESSAIVELSCDAEEKMKELNSFNACEFMGLSKGSNPAEIKKARNKLALMVHPDKALSWISGKIDWMTERQSSAVKEKQLEIQKELKEQMEHLFKQLNNAAETLLDERA